MKRGEFYLLVVLFLMGAFLSVATEDFFSLENLFDLLVSYSFVGIMATGLLVVLISGGIDISFTATATVAQYVVAMYIIKHGGSWFTAFAMAGAIGITLGAINGLLVHYLKVSAIIITISTLNIFYGLLIFITKGKWLYDFPEWFVNGWELFRFQSSSGNIYSLSMPIVALIVAFAFTAFLLNKTVLGRGIYAMGGHQEAAKRMGFNILGIHVFVYCYMGLVAAWAAIIQAQVVQTVAPNSIVGRELEVLAAVVLGGANLAGGAGSLLGTFLGVALIAVLSNGLTLLGVSSYWHQIVIGFVILISVSVTAWNSKNKERKGADIDVEA